jgi:hypothetical protein
VADTFESISLAHWLGEDSLQLSLLPFFSLDRSLWKASSQMLDDPIHRKAWLTIQTKGSVRCHPAALATLMTWGFACDNTCEYENACNVTCKLCVGFQQNKLMHTSS